MSSTPETSRTGAALVLHARALSWRPPGRAEPLFEPLELRLHAADRVALVGANGSGKSVLLRLLGGRLEPSGGALERAPARTALLPQDDLPGRPGDSALAWLLAAHADLAALRSRIDAAEREGVPDPERYADDLADYAARGGWELTARLEAEAARLGLPDDVLARPAATLSGGERRRLALLAALARPSELLALDEPSNHLDREGIAWLVERVRAFPGAVLLASHDRALIDDVATEVLELERGRWRRTRGGWREHAAARAAERSHRLRERDRLEREIAAAREAARGYDAWGDRKEAEKSGALDRGFIGARAARLKRRAVALRDRALARADELERVRPWIAKQRSLAFDEAEVPRGTCLTVRPSEAAPGATEPPRARDGFAVAWGERVALTGPNGAGKTTLLRALLEPLAARCVLPPEAPAVAAGIEATWAPRARPGWLPQHLPAVPATRSPGGAAASADAFAPEDAERARTLLGGLGFGADAFATPPAALSGGERRKLALVRVLLARPNALLLDEPTTDLDLPGIELLEAALLGFAGTLIVVTHDRRLSEALGAREIAV